MPDEYTCPVCDRSFDSERGLHVHQAQMHEDVSETDTGEETSPDGSDTTETRRERKTIDLSFSIKQAVIVSFIAGFLFGGVAMAGVFGASPTTALMAGPPNTSGDSPDTPSDGGSDLPRGVNTGVDVSALNISGEPTMGSSDAPIVFVAWEDFQCPFCKRFEQQTFPQIKNNFIETGKVQFVFKDFPFLGQDSFTAAMASECVWKQVGQSNPEAYWNWFNTMFDRQDGENRGWGSKEDILNMTASISGINASQVRQCMNENPQKLRDEITADKSMGRRLGITGTPGFIVYKRGSDQGYRIVGAQPYSVFEVVLNRLTG